MEIYEEGHVRVAVYDALGDDVVWAVAEVLGGGRLGF
jgi:hypothetical protein